MSTEKHILQPRLVPLSHTKRHFLLSEASLNLQHTSSLLPSNGISTVVNKRYVTVTVLLFLLRECTPWPKMKCFLSPGTPRKCIQLKETSKTGSSLMSAYEISQALSTGSRFMQGPHNSTVTAPTPPITPKIFLIKIPK